MIFSGLSRFQVNVSRDLGLGMVMPGDRGSAPKVGAGVTPKAGGRPGVLRGVNLQLVSKSRAPGTYPLGGVVGTPGMEVLENGMAPPSSARPRPSLSIHRHPPCKYIYLSPRWW